MASALVILILGVVCTAFRALVLSGHSHKFLEHDRWKYDTGLRYSWLFLGPLFLSAIAVGTSALLNEVLALGLAWAIGALSVWVVAPRLARLL